MRKITQIFSLLFLTLLMISCDNESINVPAEASNDLVAIQEVVNQENVTDYAINNSLNTQIDYFLGNYSVQQFSNGLMILANFYDQTDALTGNQEFEYDASKRLTSKSYYSNETATLVLYFTTTFAYSGNEILSTKTIYNPDGSIEFTELSNVFTLNSNNEIIKYEDFNFGGVWEATYTNGNLATVVVSGYGNKDGSAAFNYTNELASESYQKEKFRFGPQWKINIMLHNQVGGYSFKQLAELGTNYLSGYSHLSPDGINNASLTVNYEFDAQERLIKQTKNKLFFTSPINTVLTNQNQ